MCINCGMGLCALCETCDCCKPKLQFVERPTSISGASDGNRRSSGEVDKIDESGNENEDEGKRSGPKGPGGRAYKIADIKDPHSTGRKRAAVLYPIQRTDSGELESCEWKGKSNCGGGKHPIVGCIDGKQQHRHHGPDKNTLNNSEGNVHRICDDCHNIWHSQNDPNYDPDNPGRHEPREAELNLLVLRLGGYYRHADALKEVEKTKDASIQVEQ